MNIEQRKEIGICGVTVTFTIAELIVLKGLSENIDCILNPKQDEMRSKTLWSEKQDKLRPCNEKLIALINKITTGIQSLDEAANDLFAEPKKEATCDTINISYEDIKAYYEAVRDNNLSLIEQLSERIKKQGFTEEQLCKQLMAFKLS